MGNATNYIKIKPLFLLFILFLIVTGGCFGNQDDGLLQSQLPPANSGITKNGTGTLGGFVVTDANNRFGAPERALASVQKAQVTLLENGLFTYTDKNGYYEFLGLAPGNYTVFAKLNDTDGACYINYAPAAVRADEKVLASQTIVLKKSASIFGRVRASDNSSAAGFLVSPENVPAAELTSDGGYFRLSAAPAEQNIYLQITKDGYNGKRYGPINISENKMYSINEDIILEPLSAATGTLGGVIADGISGSPVSSVFIKFYEYAGGVKTLYKTAYGDSAGNFSFSAAGDKNYIIELIKQDYFNLTKSMYLTSGEQINLSLKLQRAKNDISYYCVTGKASDAAGASIAGVKIYSVPSSEQALTGANGVYKINLSDGIYDLYASRPGYSDSSVRVTARPHINSTGEINFTLQRSNISELYALSGTVTDVNSAPLINAKISIDKNNLYTYTNQSGVYSFYLQSGTYEINATNNAGLEKTLTYFMGLSPQKLDIKIIK